MIKINLLPPNLYEGKVIRNIGVAFGVFAIVVVAGFLFWNSTIKAETDTTKAQADEAQQLSQQADGIKSQASGERAKITPVTQKVKFFDAVYKHNESFVELYSELAKFTYKRVAYSGVSLAADGTMTLQATAPNLRDVGRYLLNMYGATHLFQSVVLSTAPSAANGNAPGAAGVAAPSIMSVAPPPPAAPAVMSAPTPAAAPTTATAGMGAINLAQNKAAAAAKRRLAFTMLCTLTADWKTKITPPVPPGGAGAAPGAPGGAPAAPMAPPNQTSPAAIAGKAGGG